MGLIHTNKFELRPYFTYLRVIVFDFVIARTHAHAHTFVACFFFFFLNMDVVLYDNRYIPIIILIILFILNQK